MQQPPQMLTSSLSSSSWWAYGLVKYRNDPGLGWLKPFLFWLAVTIRIVTLWIPIKYVMNPAKTVYRHTVYRGYEAIPSKLHQPLAAAGTVAVFLVGSMIPEESSENTRAARAQSLFGLIVMIGVMTLTSRNWKRIPWHTVIGGMLTQFVVAVFVLRTQAGFDIFNFVSEMARTLLGFAKAGLEFLTDSDVPNLPWFFTGVIPAIIFFVALVSLLYHVGLIQWFIGKFAVFFFWTLRVSGAEAVVASATPFIGQGESAMLIRPFVAHLTMAELHQVMTCGFATIAGSVLVAYIGMGLNAQALVSSCIMSIPASIAISKMRYPETEETLTSGRVVVPDDDEHKASNALHAFANGAWLGLKIAGMIVSTLLCIIAFVALVNAWLGWWASYFGMLGKDVNGVPRLSLQLILGYLFYPVAWLLGVPNKDLLSVGELIGTKIIINEFAAFAALTKDAAYADMLPRSQLIATYACCVSTPYSRFASRHETFAHNFHRVLATLVRSAPRLVSCPSSPPLVPAMSRSLPSLLSSLVSLPRLPPRPSLVCSPLMASSSRLLAPLPARKIGVTWTGPTDRGTSRIRAR